MGSPVDNNWVGSLRERLAVLVGEHNAPSIFGRILRGYCAGDRYYHDLSHLKLLFENYTWVAPFILDKEAVELAIFFHDIILDTRAKDNEARSADLALELLRSCVGAETLQHTCDMINATAGHLPSTDTDTQYFLDIDLSPLGQPATEWASLNSWVRNEYQWVPEADYRDERKNVLVGFARREHLYQTVFFRTLYEEQARQNLRWAIGETK